MVDIQLTDYHNFIELLLEFKMTPDDLMIPIPNFLIEDRKEETDAMATLLVTTTNKIITKKKTLNAKFFASDEQIVIEHPLTLLDAIRIIQIHEKGRQGKLRAQYLRDLR